MSLRRREQSATTAVLDQQDDTPPFEVEDTRVPDSDPGVIPISQGWDAAEEQRPASKYPDRLKLSDEPVLVKFLTSQPISWQQHFVKSLNKPFVCLRKSDSRGCPLCAIGDTPRARHLMTVADLSGDDAVAKKLEFGNKLLKDLKAVHEGPRGPLDRYCIRLSSRGTGYDITYTVDVVKDRDLEEEEHLSPADVKEAIQGLEPLGIDAVYMTTYEDLVEIAEDLV